MSPGHCYHVARWARSLDLGYELFPEMALVRIGTAVLLVTAGDVMAAF